MDTLVRIRGADTHRLGFSSKGRPQHDIKNRRAPFGFTAATGGVSAACSCGASGQRWRSRRCCHHRPAELAVGDGTEPQVIVPREIEQHVVAPVAWELTDTYSRRGKTSARMPRSSVLRSSAGVSIGRHGPHPSRTARSVRISDRPWHDGYDLRGQRVASETLPCGRRAPLWVPARRSRSSP